ncbi:hypothetical protein QN386_25530, partial [Pseudomonas sp. CCI3.2]|nr:hypothetical protein [Pseudomonas sp. MH10out]MEB0104665.1 hypothetical protein [Pseudomonas sp. CCI3.2]MEB0133630.1 hypothetical protein [Pseudomonas sp. CCI2.4]MEB0160893.1 hypothetical protein [Pseudomonas sp. AH2 (2023)]MEB0170426.1 hypothetical protein [Pseudomonas sp. CCC4.4]
LPTQAPTHCPYVGELNDVYLDFGLGSPKVFAWQVTLGAPFNGFVMCSFILPLLSGLIGLFIGYDLSEAWVLIAGTHRVGLPLTTGVALFVSAMSFLIWFYVHNKYEEIIPTRFNRQRR